jgi:hypothetical protein
LAVFRLTTSSYLVGVCTGRSAGFAPALSAVLACERQQVRSGIAKYGIVDPDPDQKRELGEVEIDLGTEQRRIRVSHDPQARTMNLHGIHSESCGKLAPLLVGHGRLVRRQTGAWVYAEGDEDAGLLIVVDGAVDLFCHGVGEQRVRVGLVGPGAAVGKACVSAADAVS